MSNFELKSLGQKILFLIKCLIGWCVLLSVFIVLLPFCIWKIFVIILARIIHPSFRSVPLRESLYVGDNVAKNAGKGRNVLANMLICVELEISSDEVELKQFAEKLDKALFQNENLKSYILKLKSHLIQFCGYPFWAESSSFSILNHVSKVEIPPGQNLLEYLNQWLTMSVQNPNSPLWEACILKQNSKEQIVFKFHHSVVDGLSVIEILRMVFQEKNPRNLQIASHSSRTGLLDKVGFIFKIPSLLFEVARLLKVQDALEFDSGPEVAQLTSSQSLNLVDLKNIAKKYDVRLQTVLLTIYAGVLQRFLAKTGRTFPEYLLFNLPQLRPNRPPNFIGNHSNAIFVPVRMTHKDPQKRLTQVENEIERIYTTNIGFINDIFLGFVSILPLKFRSYLANGMSNPTRCTISPLRMFELQGYQTRAVIGGNAILGPITAHSGAVSVVTSFQEKVIWTITGAKNLFQTQEQLDLLTGQFLNQEIYELTTTDTSNPAKKPDQCEINIESEALN